MPVEIPGMEKPVDTKAQGMSMGAVQKKVSASPGGSISELAEELNNTSTRLKIIEERYENLRRKMQVVEQNMLTENKKIMTELKLTNSDVLDIRKDMEDLKDKMRLVIKEVKLSAKNEDVLELKKYIEVWEPLNFITRSELKKIIDIDVKEVIKDTIREELKKSHNQD